MRLGDYGCYNQLMARVKPQLATILALCCLWAAAYPAMHPCLCQWLPGDCTHAADAAETGAACCADSAQPKPRPSEDACCGRLGCMDSSTGNLLAGLILSVEPRGGDPQESTLVDLMLPRAVACPNSGSTTSTGHSPPNDANVAPHIATTVLRC